MKIKTLLPAMFLLLLVGLYTPASYSQYAFKCTIANEVFVDANTLTFDFYIGNTGQALTLYSFQVGLTYNVAGLGGAANLNTAVWSNFNAAVVTAGMQNTAPGKTTAGVLKCAAKVSPGGPGSGVVIPQVTGTNLGMKWATMTVTSTTPFVQTLGNGPVFTWCFVTAQYPTKMQSGYALDGTTASVTDITANGTYNYFNTFDIGVLPVELGTLTSTAQGRSVILNWSTKTEKNSDRFEVERSLVSTSAWSTVGTVKASVLSNSTKNYSYTDNKLQSGKYQYRLKMVDNNGSFAYSVVTETEVALPKDFAVSQNYPNPFNPSTRIDYQVPMDSKVIMEVYNITGQKVSELVNQNQTAGYYTVDFGATKLSSGVYIYRISAQENATGKNFSSIKKMMLLK